MKYLAKDFINDLKIKKAKKYKAYSDYDVKESAEEIYLVASNEASFYGKKDAKGAIEYARKIYSKNKIEDINSMVKDAIPLALKQLLADWKEEGHI
jgi:hypothetical protein